jgi:glyoxylase-like metal-dependent hydrolase (beta-lactamase superfamily II)
VKYVISENGQGHAVYGNHYWKSQGATLIGHIDAQHEIDEKGFSGLTRMREYAKEFAQDTDLVNFDITFDYNYVIDLGSLTVIAKNYGSAHSPGDISVLVPDDQVVLAGDMAFHVRMPPIFDNTDTALWIESFDLFATEVSDWTIVPGHGGPTNLATVTAGTKDYLVFLRAKVQQILDAGGSLDEAYKIDQTAYKRWHTYEELAARNAGRVFERMEFE